MQDIPGSGSASDGKDGYTKSKWALINGLSTHYEVAGQGSATIVLLHEVGGSMASWDAIAPALSGHFRTLRYDQRGSGLSEKVRAPFGLNDLVDDLAQLLAATQIVPPYHLVGTAAGAAIALLFAASHPSQVGKLVLCSPATEINEQRHAYLDRRAALAEREGMQATLALSLANSYPPIVRRDPAIYEAYKARFLAQDPLSYALMNRALMEVDTTKALHAIHCPTLVLAGRHDLVRPPDEVAKFARRLPDTRFAILDGGHLLSLQVSDACYAALNAFLSEQDEEKEAERMQFEEEEA